MDSALVEQLFTFVLGLAGGAVAGIGIRWASARRCTRLEWAVGDLQQRVGNLQGRKAATARWDRETTLEQEFSKMQATPAAPRRRYDNDPLGE